ncbi:phage tail assembly protein [Tardiphaga sp. 11_C7_N12_6]|uniref:phage tail assembly protein n=1 Tax=Tardiphaga sp. 11_C7_N12_6 TaxID=3240789 RepID=UPI003F2476FF
MNAPFEIDLHHPVEVGGVTHDKLTVASIDAIANFRSNSAEQVILSMSRVFGVSRRVVRHLEPADAQRAGDLICSLLNEAAG